MATPLAPWTKAMLARLADGDWHTVDEMLSAALPTIPQQRAARVAERGRARFRARNAAAGKTANPSNSRAGDAALAGARDIARSTLLGLTRRGRLEHTGDKYRLAPKGRQP